MAQLRPFDLLDEVGLESRLEPRHQRMLRVKHDEIGLDLIVISEVVLWRTRVSARVCVT